MEVIIPRQMSRGYLDLNERSERFRLSRRHPRYKKLGDIKIFSYADPEEIVGLIEDQLKKLGLPK